jgi:hypothetical protein
MTDQASHWLPCLLITDIKPNHEIYQDFYHPESVPIKEADVYVPAKQEGE